MQVQHDDSKPNQAEQDFNWSVLIDRISQRQVIPIIGPQLLEVVVTADDGTTSSVPFYRIVAQTLCDQCGIEFPGANGHTAWDLHVAVAAVIEARKEAPQKIRLRVEQIIKSFPLTTVLSPALSSLASIEEFYLIVSLTCDDFLRSLLPNAEFATFSPRTSTEDVIESSFPQSGRRSVFCLLGSVNSRVGFAIHEEDVLEYIYSLQTGSSRMLRNVLTELKLRDLLFIGCGFPDWLGRSLLRLFNEHRLSAKSTQEFFSDHMPDPSLTAYVSRFSSTTMTFDSEPNVFVDTLVKRWSEIKPASNQIAHIAPKPITPKANGPTAFISYASENGRAARRLAETLPRLGFVDVWFDKKQLLGGEDWSDRIDEAIEACDFFVPLLSTEADSRRSGIFWGEWEAALKRAPNVADVFIIPIGIDRDPPSKDDHPRIARERRELFGRHIIHAPDGVLSEDDRIKLQEQVRRFRKLD